MKGVRFEARGTGIECLDIIRGRISKRFDDSVVLLDPYAPMVSWDANISGKNIKLKTKETEQPAKRTRDVRFQIETVRLGKRGPSEN